MWILTFFKNLSFSNIIKILLSIILLTSIIAVIYYRNKCNDLISALNATQQLLEVNKTNNKILKDTIDINKEIYSKREIELEKIINREREICNQSKDNIKAAHDILLNLVEDTEVDNATVDNTDYNNNQNRIISSTKINEDKLDSAKNKYMELYNKSISSWNALTVK